MKKITLAFCIGLLIATLGAHAQSVFSFSAPEVDSFTEGVYPDTGPEPNDTFTKMISYIVNNGNTPLSLHWQLITNQTNRPEDWILMGIADNRMVRNGWSLESGMTDTIQHTSPIPPGDSCFIEVTTFVTVYADSGIGHFYLRVFDDNETQVDTLRFRLHKLTPALPRPGTAVETVSQAGMAGPYPNPATGDLTIPLKNAERAKLLTVTDHSGREILRTDHFKTSAAGVHLHTGLFPPGMYVIHIKDHAGKSLSVQKFVRQ